MAVNYGTSVVNLPKKCIKIWKLHPRTHNNLICKFISNFTHSLEKIHISFIYSALNHPNELVRLLLHVKLASANSVFVIYVLNTRLHEKIGTNRIPF